MDETKHAKAFYRHQRRDFRHKPKTHSGMIFTQNATPCGTLTQGLGLCHNTLMPVRTPRLGLCPNTLTPALTQELGLCCNTLKLATTPRIGLCHNTLTPASTQGPGLCHNTLTPARTPRAWAVSQIETSNNAKAWALNCVFPTTPVFMLCVFSSGGPAHLLVFCVYS